MKIFKNYVSVCSLEIKKKIIIFFFVIILNKITHLMFAKTKTKNKNHF